MATLNEAGRAAVHRELMEQLSRERDSLGALTKQELRAVIDAADTWIHNNAASYNTALPQPGRSALTAAQKARILAILMLRRYDSGV